MRSKYFFFNKKASSSELMSTTLAKLAILAFIIALSVPIFSNLMSGFTKSNIPFSVESSFDKLVTNVAISHNTKSDHTTVYGVEKGYYLAYRTQSVISRSDCNTNDCLCLISLKEEKVLKCASFDFDISMNTIVTVLDDELNVKSKKEKNSCVSKDMNYCDPVVFRGGDYVTDLYVVNIISNNNDVSLEFTSKIYG